MKAKDLKSKLQDRKSLPSVEETKEKISQDMQSHLSTLKENQNNLITSRMEDISKAKALMKQSQRTARTVLLKSQQERRLQETCIRQERYHKGLRGLLDRLTGRHNRIKEQNEWETRQAEERDRQEKDALIFKQLQERQHLQQRGERLELF